MNEIFYPGCNENLDIRFSILRYINILVKSLAADCHESAGKGFKPSRKYLEI